MNDTYRITDRPEAIRRVQKYLKGVDGCADVIPSGFYDEATERAVKNFRIRRGLGESGAVDYETFTLLFEEYDSIQKAKKAALLWGGRMALPVSEGATHDDMVHLNGLVAEMMDYYGREHRVRPIRVFGRETSRAVSELRKIYHLSDGAFIDSALYGRMRADRASISQFDRKRR